MIRQISVRMMSGTRTVYYYYLLHWDNEWQCINHYTVVWKTIFVYHRFVQICQQNNWKTIRTYAINCCGWLTSWNQELLDSGAYCSTTWCEVLDSWSGWSTDGSEFYHILSIMSKFINVLWYCSTSAIKCANSWFRKSVNCVL